MRTKSRFATAVALLLPLVGVSCTSEPINPQPHPTELTDRQAGTLALQYLRQNNVPNGMIVREERTCNAWWCYYETAFDASGRPPSLCYLLRVLDDGTVVQFH
jgi:hypothetical protein